jgi:tetratricopeptide (TPR) repeat protein
VFGPLGDAVTVDGERDVHGTGPGIPFWMQGEPWRRVRRHTMRSRLLVGMTLAAALGAPVARSAEVRRGRFAITFEERSPLSSPESLKQRLGSLAQPMGGKDYELSGIEFEVIVPDGYDPAIPCGLLFDEFALRADMVAPIFARHGLICVRLPSAQPAAILDAVHNMKKLYNIDSDRTYVFGSAIASVLGISHPDVFTGAVCVAVFYFRDVSENWRELQDLPGIFPRPAEHLLELARTRSRFAIMSGSPDALGPQNAAVVENGFREDGFKHVECVHLPGSESRVTPEFLDEGLAALDKPLLARAQVSYKEGLRLEKGGRLGEALEAYLKSLRCDPHSKWADDAAARAASLKARAERETAGAEAAIAEERYADAVNTLRGVLARFGEKGAPEAAELLAMIEADPEIQRRLKAALEKKAHDKLEEAARESLETARRIFEQDKVKGYDALRNVAEQHAATTAGREAAAEVRRIMADPDLRAQVEGAKDTKAAERLLRQARNYVANGMNAAARKKLDEIVAKFPETGAATEAKKLLGDLGAK